MPEVLQQQKRGLDRRQRHSVSGSDWIWRCRLALVAILLILEEFLHGVAILRAHQAAPPPAVLSPAREDISGLFRLKARGSYPLWTAR